MVRDRPHARLWRFTGWMMLLALVGGFAVWASGQVSRAVNVEMRRR